MFVYKLTLPDNTEYIGSCRDIDKRLREHKSRSKTSPNFQKICAAIAKFGFENIRIEVLAILESRNLAYEFEKNAIIAARIDGVSLLNDDGIRKPRSYSRKLDSKIMAERARKAWENPETRERLVRAAKRRSLANPDAMKARQKLANISRVENRPLVRLFNKIGDLLIETKSTKELAEFLSVNQSSVCRYIREERTPRKYKIEVVR